jgi:hypothetical protein
MVKNNPIFSAVVIGEELEKRLAVIILVVAHNFSKTRLDLSDEIFSFDKFPRINCY